MASDFKSLRSSSRTSLDTLSRELEKTARGGGFQQDERYWKPTTDKAGNGFAVIRFLPAPPNEDVPYVQLWNHFFKGPTGQVYAENSLTTIGREDPVSQENSRLWATGTEANKKIARERKRKQNFISNIYVVKDPGNPAAEGKVFLYKYGKKIFEKLNMKMNPAPEEGLDPINPFDLWEGCNMRLRVRQVENFPNYETSDFTDPAPLLDSDEALEKVWRSQYSLQAEVAPDKFKSYDELKARMDKVLGAAPSQHHEDDRPPRNTAASRFDEPSGPKAEPRAERAVESRPPPSVEEDDEMNFFQRLANED